MIVWKKIWKENFHFQKKYFNMKDLAISEFGYVNDEAYHS